MYIMSQKMLLDLAKRPDHIFIPTANILLAVPDITDAELQGVAKALTQGVIATWIQGIVGQMRGEHTWTRSMCNDDVRSEYPNVTGEQIEHIFAVMEDRYDFGHEYIQQIVDEIYPDEKPIDRGEKP